MTSGIYDTGLSGRFPSGQREQTVNLSAKPSEVRILPSPPWVVGGNSSVGRASAFQAEGRGFESRFPLQNSSCHFLGAGRNKADRPGPRSSVVERFLGKEEVIGSIPIVGSIENQSARRGCEN